MQNEFWNSKLVCVTGGDGFLGKHIVKKLKERGAIVFVPRREEYDLRKMEDCMKVTKGQEIVFHLAGVLGSVEFHLSKPAEIYFDNMAMNLNMIEAAKQNNITKFVGMSSASAYPSQAKIPLKEEDLFNGSPEKIKQTYGYAKRMMVIQAKAYNQQYGLNIIPLLMFNMYGPGDNFSKESAHVIPSLIMKHLEDDVVEVLGHPESIRSFFYVEDAAEAVIIAAEKYNEAEPINICSSEEVTIRKLVELIRNITNFKGKTIWKDKKAEISIRCADNTKAKNILGFEASTSLEEGLKKTIEWYKKQRGYNG